MNATRAILWVLGIVFVLGGAYMLYFQAGLNRWVSIGVLTAGFLLFIGLAVMGFAGRAPSDTPTVVEDREVVRDGPVYERRR
ncbi:MAG TPA: hypothetical protein VM241_07985 [Candidatus Thermoplasmatota archaeon]|jgi:protein-S-isoprenylcysteine O-methyltransferase Ste14|nr:hypothetical protein [Candidatus Thermoplasmatota archaeon]